MSLRLDTVQRHLAHITTEKIKEQYNIPVIINSIKIKNLNEATLDNVLILDNSNDTLLYARKAMASIAPLKLIDGMLHINTLVFETPDVRLTRSTPDAQLNIQFILDKINKNDTNGSDTDLRINQLLINDGSFSYNVMSQEYTETGLDLNHISIKDFSCNLSLKNFSKENLNLYIRSIKGHEKCGLEIKRLRARIKTRDKGLIFSDLIVELPGSVITSDSIEITDIQDTFPQSNIKGELYSKNFSSSDITPIFPEVKWELPELSFCITGEINSNIAQGNIHISTCDSSLFFEGETIIKQPYSQKREIEVSMRKLFLKESAIEEFTSMIDKAPQGIASKFGDTDITGNAYYSLDSLRAKAIVSCRNGILDTNFTIDSCGNYDLIANGKNIQLGKLLANDEIKHCNIKATSAGNIHDKTDIANFNINISSLRYKGYTYSLLNIKGKADSMGLAARLFVSDPALNARMSIDYLKNSDNKRIILALHVDTFIPYNLNLSKRQTGNIFSFKLEGNHTSYKNNKSITSIKVNDFVHSDSKESYRINNIYVYDDNTDKKRAITINSDILKADLIGEFNTSSLQECIASITKEHLPSLQMKRKGSKHKNSFFYKVEITDSRLFTKLFDLPFTINERSIISGSCHDAASTSNINAKLNNINIGNTLLRTIEINSSSNKENLVINATLRKPTTKNKNVSDYYNKGNDLIINLYSQIYNDTINSTVDWNSNSESANSLGSLKLGLNLARDKKDNLRFNANVAPSHFMLNGQEWHITPGSIAGNNKEFTVKDLQLFSKEQSLKIHGIAGMFIDDSLNVELKNMDVSTILRLTNFRTFNFAGKATGAIHLTSLLHRIDANGQLCIDSLFVDNTHMGRGDIAIGWMDYNKTLTLDSKIHGSSKTSKVTGFLSQPRDTIMLKIEANDLNIGFLGNKVRNFISDATGTANGTAYIIGAWSKVNLIGATALNCNLKVKANSTTYHINGDTLYMSPTSIHFNNVGIQDKFGNKGKVSGSLGHTHFSNWTCNINVNTDNLLVYDTYGFDSNPFYGTVFATGTANINSQGSNLTLKANLKSEPNSSFTYNSTAASGARDNSFITFTDSRKNNTILKEPVYKKPESTFTLGDSKINLDFMLDVTETLHVKVYTNLKTDDYIDFYGRGTINALYDEKNGFSMKGSLNLDRGTYKFTIQDIFPKEFKIDQGSTLAFDGDPFKAGLNLKTKHLVPSASLSDLTTETSNKKTVKVNCVMDISGTLESPILNFDLELPEGNEEEKELLASVASTPEQKNMQFIYLLGVGKFYTFDYNNTGGDNQSSTAMESLISNTLSGQLNNMLGQIIDNDNWDISGNFSTSEKGWNRMEVEGMLRGRLLNNRLLINGNFGYRDNPIANNSFIGDFEIQWLLNKKGNVNLKAYSKTNDRYFSKTNLTTQGAGVLFKLDFNKWRWWKKDEEE